MTSDWKLSAPGNIVWCFARSMEAPKTDLDLIESRLKDAQADHAAWRLHAKGVKK